MLRKVEKIRNTQFFLGKAVENLEVVAQNVSGALHLRDALHHESTLETRAATHFTNTVQFYHHDFEQLHLELVEEEIDFSFG